MKSVIAPHGNLSGKIYFCGKELSETDSREQAEKIGFVMQSCDNQIVTDKVWHELAFGLENLGYSTPEIRRKTAEMASFFGIQTWFDKKVTELSGGQKQILSLASVMVMQPDVLILDEPSAQLDPIAAEEFLKTVEKINRELGTTVILSEHRLEEVFAVSDRVIVMDIGKIIADDEPKKMGEILRTLNHDMLSALPVPMRIFYSVKSSLECPLTVREGRSWLEEYSEKNPLNESAIPEPEKNVFPETAVEIKDVWFRYGKNLPDIIKGLNIKIYKGEFFCIAGGNGTGKTTALSLIGGLNTPYRGNIFINGKNILKIRNPYNGLIGVLPQNPQSVFVKNTVRLDLTEILSDRKIPKEEREKAVETAAKLCRIDNLLESHPYDLSGGEQQRAALAKILLMSPEILLLDEPTKGLDAHFKEIFADIIHDLKSRGVTVIAVTHDTEFCAEYADRCAMFFDGNITSEGEPREFFGGNNFYTTSANRMARTTIPKAVLTEDIIRACGGDIRDKKENKKPKTEFFGNNSEEKPPQPKTKPISAARIVSGSIFSFLFILTSVICFADIKLPEFTMMNIFGIEIIRITAIAEAAAAIICFFPQKEFGIKTVQQPLRGGKSGKRTVAAALITLFVIPLTIYAGTFFFGSRKYYFISLLIILETMIPFCFVFENRKPQARELVIISVLCTIAVGGRAAFFMVPQFKPVVAVVIISGICFGGETGFFVGVVTGFVSNFFFGQGPWTPWQMFAFGIIGFIAGILFKNGFMKKTKISLCIFGFFATLIIYGGIMNPASVIMSQENLSAAMIAASYVTGLPFDMIHALSTAFFLWFLAEPMIEKLERIKVKYGLIEA